MALSWAVSLQPVLTPSGLTQGHGRGEESAGSREHGECTVCGRREAWTRPGLGPLNGSPTQPCPPSHILPTSSGRGGAGKVPLEVTGEPLGQTGPSHPVPDTKRGKVAWVWDPGTGSRCPQGFQPGRPCSSHGICGGRAQAARLPADQQLHGLGGRSRRGSREPTPLRGPFWSCAPGTQQTVNHRAAVGGASPQLEAFSFSPKLNTS